jgi:hypothetical protein
VVPTIVPELLKDLSPRAPREPMAAMLQMKPDIEEMKRAYADE